MIINDYENKEKYNELKKQYLLRLIALTDINSNNFLAKVNEVINRNLEQEANISPNGILYYILSLYATKDLNKKALQNPSKYHIPYINYADLTKNLKLVKTNKEEIQFRLIVASFPELIHKLTTHDIHFYRLYTSLYCGTTLGKCHKLCLCYPTQNFNIVTAYIPDVFSPLRFLHTYQENDKQIIDLSHNLIFDKDTFYNVFKPQIVSSLTNEEWIHDFKSGKIHDSIKDYLVNPQK